MTEKEQQKAAREAEQKRAHAERIAAEAAATAKRHEFADLGCTFTKYACWCTALSVGWVDGHGQPLRGDKVLTEAKVLKAASAIANKDECEELRELIGKILACLRANMLRQTITTTDNTDFEKMLNGWSERATAIEKGNE